jgi:hypothetical protein
MLGPIEALLTDRLRTILPPGTEVITGPLLTPPQTPLVRVLARRLSRPLPLAGEAPPDPEPAWLSRRDRLSPDAPPPGGDGRSFTLPAAALPVIEEVQSPPGRIAVRGDDYAIEGRTLRFLTAPAAPVEVLTRGGPARGWRERGPVTVRTDVVALAPDAATADGLITIALAAGLDALAGQEVVTLAWTDGPGLRIRLLGMRVFLLDVGRGTEAVGAARWARTTAGLHLRGELETMVIQGAAPDAGVIRYVETDLILPPGDRRTRIVTDHCETAS